MHSAIDYWNGEKIEFYERASKESDFHIRLTSAIKESIERSKNAIEKESGTGHTSELLCREDYKIRGVDLNDKEAERDKRRSGLDIFKEENIFDLKERPDTLLIFFELEDECLERLVKIPRRNTLLIVNRNKSQRELEGGAKKPSKRILESLYSIEDINITTREPSLSFDQPLKDERDAKRAHIKKELFEKMKSRIEKRGERYPLLSRDEKDLLLIDTRRKT